MPQMQVEWSRHPCRSGGSSQLESMCPTSLADWTMAGPGGHQRWEAEALYKTDCSTLHKSWISGPATSTEVKERDLTERKRKAAQDQPSPV